MSYVGKWVFHSIGVMNEADELVYLGADEYMVFPMLYIDETDEEAVAEEVKERKKTVGSQLAVCEDGKLYMLMPLPEEVSQQEIDEAVSAGYIKLYDGMMTDEPMKCEEREDGLWLEVGMEMSDDGWVKLSDENGFLKFMSMRFVKSE